MKLNKKNPGRKLTLVLTFALLCILRNAAAKDMRVDALNVIDLTYEFDSDTIYWPNEKGFEWQKISWGVSPDGSWYAAGHYAASEHGGTHMDAPIHFSQGGLTVDQIPVANLIGPVDVIDMAEACNRNPDYRLTLDDITVWEKQHGRILPGSLVLARSGWGKYWPDKKRYLGSDTGGDVKNLHFPGFSAEAARFLVLQRNIRGIGIDTASMDYGPSESFEVHQVILGAGLYGLENVAHTEMLPATGATLVALPMKIKGGSGAPTRIVAILP